MKSDITVLLDRSGSMASIKDDTIGGFNTFLDEQKALPGEATISLVQFDTQGYDRVIDAKPIAQAEPLSDKTFVPRGGTPLLDAMGRVIAETGARLKAMANAERPENVIMVIITDGQENASKEFTREAVLKSVTHQQDVYKWNFIYLGANQDAIQSARDMGIPMAAAANYTANNTSDAYSAASSMTSQGRAGLRATLTASMRANLVRPPSSKGKPKGAPTR